MFRDRAHHHTGRLCTHGILPSNTKLGLHFCASAWIGRGIGYEYMDSTEEPGGIPPWRTSPLSPRGFLCNFIVRTWLEKLLKRQKYSLMFVLMTQQNPLPGAILYVWCANQRALNHTRCGYSCPFRRKAQPSSVLTYWFCIDLMMMHYHTSFWLTCH